MQDLSIDRADVADAREILSLQRVAYQSEAQLYQDRAIPPLQQKLSELLEEFDRALFLKATAKDRIVGSVRGHVDAQTCHIGRLIVHPDFQGRGIGSLLMANMETRFPNVSRFELFTGHKSVGNLRLYERLGYQERRREQVHPGLTFVFLGKVNPSLGAHANHG